MSASPDDSVGRRIKVLRQQYGLTQSDLAKELGVSRAFVAQWETDRGGETPYLGKIADFLSMPVEVFLTGMVESGTIETVTHDEAELIRLYRQSAPQQRLELLHLLRLRRHKTV